MYQTEKNAVPNPDFLNHGYMYVQARLEKVYFSPAWFTEKQWNFSAYLFFKDEDEDITQNRVFNSTRSIKISQYICASQLRGVRSTRPASRFQENVIQLLCSIVPKRHVQAGINEKSRVQRGNLSKQNIDVTLTSRQRQSTFAKR